MAEDKRRYKATIAGRTYTIVAKKSEEHLKVVSELANGRITQLKSAMPDLDVEQRSILVAVNAISETISKQAELDELQGKIAHLEKEHEKQLKMITAKSSIENQAEILKEEKPVKKTAKEAGSRFVRPTTASETRLQKAKQQEKTQQNMPASTKNKLTKQNQGQRPSGNR